MIGFLADYWHQWAAIALFSAFLFCFKWVRPNFGLPASLLMAAVSYSAIYTWILVENRYLRVDAYNQTSLRFFAADSLAKMFLILTPLMVLSKRRWTFLLMGEVATTWFIILSSGVSLWQATKGCTGINCGGLIGNASISMSCLACMLPMAVKSWRFQWPILAMAAGAILLSKSSIALGLLVVYVVLYLDRGKAWKTWAAHGSAAAVCLLGFGKLAVGKELLNDSDRFMIWKFMFDRWRAPWNLIQGTGLGTYHVLSINLQHRPNIPAVSDGFWWETLHNEPLQMLFECGIVGLVLLCCTYYSALAKVFRERNFPIAMSIVLYGLYMCLNPALHNPIPVLFGAWLFVYALRKPEEYL